jgi:hypothetical protein
MNGPSFGYLNLLGQGLDAPAPAPHPTLDLPADTITPTGAAMAPTPAVYNAPTSQPWQPPADPLGAPPAPSAYNPGVAKNPLEGLDLVSMGAAAGPPMPTPEEKAADQAAKTASPSLASAGPDDVQYRQVGGGAVTPAHEAYGRGPLQHEALMASFEPEAEAATRGDFRNQIVSQIAQDEYEYQARQALAQQEAAQKVATQRAAELQHLEMDYADQAQKLGQMKLDSNRWWANKSTGDKVASLLLVAVGGFSALGNGGHNFALDGVMRDIDADVAAQKFDYDVGLDQAKAAQNAYGMALQRYGSEDAALALARAAGLNYAAAKANALKAQYGGADSANAADEIRAKLEAERDKTLAAGFKFIPSQVAAPKYKVSIRGQELPGTLGEKEAQAAVVEHGVKPAERVDEKVVEGGIQSTLADRKQQGEERLQAQKLAAESQKKGAENIVVLPNGESVAAPSSAEATKLRELATSVSNAQQLVNEARTIRSDANWLASPTKAKRLKQIQAELTLSFKDRGGLGALSGPDTKLAQDATADLLSFPGIGTDSALEGFAKTTDRALQNRVRTIAGAPDNAQGKLSPEAQKSLQVHGKK